MPETKLVSCTIMVKSLRNDNKPRQINTYLTVNDIPNKVN